MRLQEEEEEEETRREKGRYVERYAEQRNYER